MHFRNGPLLYKHYILLLLLLVVVVVVVVVVVTASVVYWSEFLTTDTEVPGSISGATRFSE